MRIPLICLLAVTLTSALEAQDGLPALAQAQVTAWTPTLKLPQGQLSAEITSIRYDLEVRGMLAQTTATIVFRNPNSTALEGALEFPLPDGATVCSYALDIHGQLVDGVIVGKDEGRLILDNEERVRRDPGLAEQVRGNIFRTRIWPLPASGTRTVRLSWTAELTVEGDAAAVRLLLPRVRLPLLDLHIDLDAAGAEPVLSGFGNLAFTRWHDHHLAEGQLTDVTPGDDLLIRLPQLPSTLVSTEERQGEHFLAISALPPVVATTSASVPARIAVAWDASSGRTQAGIACGRAALLALLTRWPTTAVDLVVFRDICEPAVACANAEAVAKLLDQLVYDGGTGLARLDLRRPALPRPDDAAWILVGDGMGTVGATLPECGDIPVNCLAAESQRDAAVLRLIAERTGGQSIDAMADSAEQAAERIAHPACRLLRIEAADGVLADVQLGHCQDRSLVMARLLRDGDVTLVFGTDGAHASADQRVHIQAHLASAISGEVVARAWAGSMSEDLAIDPLENQDRLLALGRRYGIVTPGSSLIVLESLDQYLRYGIEPPASSVQLHQDFLACLKQRNGDFRLQHVIHGEELAVRWGRQVAWWNGQLPAPVPPVVAQHGPAPADRAPGMYGAIAGNAPPTRVAQMPAQPLAQDAREPTPAPAIATGAIQDMPMDGQAFSAIGSSSARSDERSIRRIAGSLSDSELDSGLVGDISITPFQPDAAYLGALSAVPAADAYATYLQQRTSHAGSPSFYLDCASFFFKRDPILGRRILSNLAQLRLDDPGLLRIYAWRLQQADDLGEAVAILRKVLRLRPEEPQSYRDLGLALALQGESSHRAAEVEEAMELLNRVATRSPMVDPRIGDAQALEQSWTRIPDIDLIAQEELNRLVTQVRRGSFDRTPVIPAIDPRLATNLDTDIRVVMGWDQDATDIDLHVVEPNGEEVFYGNRLSSDGGMLSHDNTVGFGPEEFLIRHAPAGSYQLSCVYYGAQPTRMFGPVTVVATVYLDWGRATERRQVMTLRLDQRSDRIAVGTLSIPGAPPADGNPATASSGTVSIAQIAQLHSGQSLSSVESELGTPLRVDGGGVQVLLYRMVGGEAIRIGLGPDLVWVRVEQNGIERDLVH